MEKIHVIYPGIEWEHPARPWRKGRDEIRRIEKWREEDAEAAFQELAKRQCLQTKDIYPLFDWHGHGEIWGQEVVLQGPNRAPVWCSRRHTGGRPNSAARSKS